MFRAYKRSVQVRLPQPVTSSHADAYRVSEDVSTGRLQAILKVPLMIAGAAAMTLVFSIFFALLLIPMSIMGLKAWRLMRKAQQRDDQTISAEYTVISESDQ